MKGSAFIRLASEQDSAYVDVYDTYGVSFVKGSYLTLVKKSASKGYVTNDSRLNNGVQMVADSDYAKLSSRQFSVTILMEASTKANFVTYLENFTAKISNGLIFLKIPSVKRVFKLVYNDMDIKQEYRGNKATFTLKLTEPDPTDRVTLT